MSDHPNMEESFSFRFKEPSADGKMRCPDCIFGSLPTGSSSFGYDPTTGETIWSGTRYTCPTCGGLGWLRICKSCGGKGGIKESLTTPPPATTQKR